MTREQIEWCKHQGERRFGLVTRAELREIGVSEATIDRLPARGWKRIHPTVLALPGVPGSWEQELMAACLWSKDGLASHLSAAVLWELPHARKGPLHITVTRCRVHPRSGLRVHHTDHLPRDHRRRMGELPVTSIERTLLDLGAVWPEFRVAAAIDNSLRRGLTTCARLDRCIGQIAKRGRRGVAPLRRLVREREFRSGTPESPLETRLFELLKRSSLPMPELQYEIRDAGHRLVARVDFCYPTQRLVIETDGWAYHSGRADWSRDLRRLNSLTKLGYRIHHVTYEDAFECPDQTLSTIAELLSG